MKVNKYENHRVTVYPDEPWFIGDKTQEEKHKEWMSACRRLIDEIKRHVDFGSIDWDFDVSYRCSFCDYEWEEDEAGPLCCEKAIDEWGKARKGGKDG